MTKQKGFTIIELIVVIAIIAVLASIVLVNVTSYIAKGKDSSIKGNMASIATIAAAFYDNNSSTFYDTTPDPDIDLWFDSAVDAGLKAIGDADGSATTGTAGGVTTYTTRQRISGAWCIAATLNNKTAGTNDLWCADSTGFKGAIAALTACDATKATCAAD